ncbi:hypothetical protein ACIHFB_34925 [Streptomyces sp. NPDC051963]|uniref:hypothetical protein n=1 Tax=Streptomyces sp. NPDC051963 TaxID=3365678 RepID=UPI0037D3FAF5
MVRIRQLIATAGMLGAVLAPMLLWAPPASAGGPTSVLVVSPTTQKAVGLYTTSPEYGRLQNLLDQSGSGRGADAQARDLAAGSGDQVNITWMIHDVTPWRQDTVLVGYDGDILINTARGTPPEGSDQWRRPQQPTQLRALLTKVGVIGKAAHQGSVGVAPAPGESTEAAAGTDDAANEAATTPRATATGGADDTEWWWALPGAAAGAVLALVLRPFASRRLPLPQLRGEPEPRQELRDIRGQ